MAFRLLLFQVTVSTLIYVIATAVVTNAVSITVMDTVIIRSSY